jgi:hypothetical protein
MNIFGIGHRSIQVEVLKVNGAKAGTFLREDIVEEELEKLQQCCVCTHISRAADAIATNGDPCAVRVILFRMDFTCNHIMAYFFSLVRQNVMVVDAKKSVSTATRLVLGDSPEPIPWQRRPSSLAYKVSQVALYQGLRRSWQCSRMLPVVGSRTDRANGLSSCKMAEQRPAKLFTSTDIM